jgi:hypothetical protein
MNLKHKKIFKHIDTIKKLIQLPPRLVRPDITIGQVLILEKNLKDIFQELENKILIFNQKRRSGPL